MFDQAREPRPPVPDPFASEAPAPRAAAPPAAPPTVAPGPRSPSADAWAAQLHASLFDDDPATLQGPARERRAALDALRADWLAAKSSDGMLDSDEGRALTARAHQLGTDRMSFADSMYARGLDPAAVHTLLEKLRGVDAAEPGKLEAEHRDERGAPLAPASSLAPAEVKLWIDAMAARFDDLRAGTPMAKIIDPTLAAAFASGTASPAAGGFMSMAAHSEGLSAGERLQMAGLDSNHHASPDIDFFDVASGRWSASAAGPGGQINEQRFPLGQAGANMIQLPLGSAAAGLAHAEAERLRANQWVETADGRVLSEYVPEMFQAGRIHSLDRKRGDHTNPYTGWGFSATRRAVDGHGDPLGVLDNQELRMPTRVPVRQGHQVATVRG
jgi:hypothetical protein